MRARPRVGHAGPVTDLLDALRATLPAGMTARPLTPDDLDAAFAVYAAAEVEDAGVLALERADVEADWSRPSVDLAADSVGLLDGGRLVAAAEVSRRGTRAEGAVHPDARGRGAGSWLAAWTEARAARLGASTVGQTVPHGSAGQRLLEGRGYGLGWTSWVLELPEGAEVADRPLPPGYRLVTADDEARWREAHRVVEDAFAEWSDRTGEVFDEWAARTVRRPGFEPWQLRLVEHAADGVVGACFTILDEQGCGFVDQVAVARSHRGRGLAQALLADGFRAARERGAVRSELATDSRTGALGLYERVGMRVSATWLHLVTEPRPAPQG